MKASTTPPRLIYKYRKFDERFLDMLMLDELYFSDPNDFNDPLDCKPSLDIDVDRGALEKILTDLRKQRLVAEKKEFANSLKYRGPNTTERIQRITESENKKFIDNIYHTAMHSEDDHEETSSSLLGWHIEQELLHRYDRGIVSFGSRGICPLMWSHYGDQHRGVCLAYSIPTEAKAQLHQVQYGGSRNVLASDIAKMENDSEARNRVDSACLLQKASSWKYEREWRLIGKRGAQESPLELEEVIFGMRCQYSVIISITQSLQNRDRTVKYFKIEEIPGSFDLTQIALDLDDPTYSQPRRSLSIYQNLFDAYDLEL